MSRRPLQQRFVAGQERRCPRFLGEGHMQRVHRTQPQLDQGIGSSSYGTGHRDIHSGAIEPEGRGQPPVFSWIAFVLQQQCGRADQLDAPLFGVFHQGRDGQGLTTDPPVRLVVKRTLVAAQVEVKSIHPLFIVSSRRWEICDLVVAERR